MKCNFPITLKQKKAGITQNYVVPCGRCSRCMKNRRMSWFIRLREELKSSFGGIFLTLTYSDENVYYNKNNVASLNKEHVVLFIRALRDKIKPMKLKYYLVGEYGETTFRPHYHLILFNVNEGHRKMIEKMWDKGMIHIGKLSEASLNYVASYHVNKWAYPLNSEPSFTLMSKRIGIAYIDNMKKHHQGNIDNAYYQYYESKVALPRYYKEKLYSKIERQVRAKQIMQEIAETNEIEKFNKEFPGEEYFKFQFDSIKAEEANFITKKHSKKL